MKTYKLSELGTIITGNTPSTKVKEYYDSNDIKFIKPNDIPKGTNMYLDQSSNYISEKAREKARLVPTNSVLVTCIGIIGKVSVTKEEVAFNQQINAIVPNEKVLPEYLALKLKYKKNSLEQLSNKSIVSNINKTNFSKFEIRIPSIKEQEKFLEVIKKNITIIDKRQQQIEALSKLQYSVFNKLFVVSDDKDAKVPLKDLCMINPRKNEVDKKLYEKEITFLPMASVSENGEVNLNETRILSDVYSNYTYFAEGDVLFAKITPCMENGKGAIVKGLKNKMGFGSTEFHVLRPNKGITPEWIYFLTKSSKFREKAEGNMTGSAGQKRVPRRFLENYQVTIPTKVKQEEFEVFYRESEKIKQKLNQSLLEFDNLYQNLIHKAFNGELFKENIKV